MEKSMSDLPKPFMKVEKGVVLQIMEDYPPYLDRGEIKKKQKELKKQLEVRIRIITHNGRFFLYRVIANKQLRRKDELN